MSTLDPATLDHIEAAAKAATPGPWEQSDSFQSVVRAPDRQIVAICDHGTEWEADAKFIAACSPSVVLALVTAARERDELRAAVVAYFSALDLAAADMLYGGEHDPLIAAESVLRALVETDPERFYCAQCWLNGAGRFEMRGDEECPNPDCVTKRNAEVTRG